MPGTFCKNLISRVADVYHGKLLLPGLGTTNWLLT
jgi:hypothetical protein